MRTEARDGSSRNRLHTEWRLGLVYPMAGRFLAPWRVSESMLRGKATLDECLDGHWGCWSAPIDL
ncbi:hypothetical protein [Brevibacillus laterosporus]|uniref:hypothetical protein n=1 Tax=Brevibacillus laterosporus TaxID=1465 RepID=UPI003CF15973